FMILLVLLSAQEGPDLEHPRIPTSSPEFVNGAAGVLKSFEKSGFEKTLETPALGASSEEAFKKRLAEMRAMSSMTGLATGSTAPEYDVVLQPGHYRRTSGRTGTQGKVVSEQALVAYITDVVAQGLQRTKNSVV